MMKRTLNHNHQTLQRRVPRSWLIRLLTGALLFFVLSGCATMNKKFTSRTKANIGLFADNTIAILSDVDLSIERNEAVFSRRFFDENGSEEKRMSELNNNMQIALYNIVDYSVSLVNMAESDRTEKEKVVAYADHLARFKEDIQYGTGMTSEQFDAKIEDIKNQPDFLSALRAAQPIISAAVIDAIMELKELTEAIETVAEKMDSKIDEEYADIIRYQKKMEEEKSNILSAFEILYDAYRTDKPDLSKLTESGVIWLPEIIPQGRPTRKDLQTIVKHLQARLDALHTIQQEIQPYWEDYRSTHRELDELTDKTVDQVKNVRLILLVWVRAHQKMATGVVDPAEWFDINDVPANLFRLGTKLL